MPTYPQSKSRPRARMAKVINRPSILISPIERIPTQVQSRNKNKAKKADEEEGTSGFYKSVLMDNHFLSANRPLGAKSPEGRY